MIAFYDAGVIALVTRELKRVLRLGTSMMQTFTLSPFPPALVEAGDLLEVHFDVSDPQGITVWIKTTALVLWHFPS